MKKPTLDEAHTALLAKLERALAVYDRDPESGKRLAVLAALLFLWDTNVKKRLTRPLEQLLNDLNPRDRNKPTSEQKFNLTCALAAVEALRLSGVPLKVAIWGVHKATHRKLSVEYLTNQRKRIPADVHRAYVPLVSNGLPDETDGEKAARLLGVVSSAFAGPWSPWSLLHAAGKIQ
jgi:hypothetical protein